jgi:GNAT superfamily N-acetyltransferase
VHLSTSRAAFKRAGLALAIRRAEAREAEALTALAHAAKRSWGYPESWIEGWHDALSFTGAMIESLPVYVALENGELAGVAALAVHGAQATLEHLWVDPRRARRGIGRALLAHMCRVAGGLGARVLRIESDPNAEAFYVRCGARRVGARRADVGAVRRSLPRLELELAGDRR